MATRTASAAQASVMPRGLRVGNVAVTSTYSVGQHNSLSIGDVIQMIKVPQGATVTWINFGSTYVDCTWTLGDGVDDDRYKTIGTLTAAQGMQVNTRVLPAYTYSTDDTIDVFVSLVSITTLTGGFYVNVIYTLDGPAG